jgi:hypothetical protein
VYSNCLFCDRPFGDNSAIEALPVGRRIAFDAEKGRLWVVCRRCERWNLTPLEERWEAIEQAERLFRDTRLRVSTEHVGLVKLAEGTELVRIGRPLRPEFAAWRYGDQFGRRRRKMLLIGAGAGVVVGSALTAGFATGVISMGVLGPSGHLVRMWAAARTVVRVPGRYGEIVELKREQLNEARIGRDGDGWYVQFNNPADGGRTHDFTGAEAERVAALLLTRLNATGASRSDVQESVREVENVGSADEFIRRLVAQPPLTRYAQRRHSPEGGFAMSALPRAHRLALEMAVHEEHERQLLTGELDDLERAWRAAEDVAAIADDLLLPPHIRRLQS